MMVAGTADDRYLTWLAKQVADFPPRKSSKTYWNLFRQLYRKEFTWFIPNDENRAQDGIELRYEWAHQTRGPAPDHNWMQLGCSFLEMLIGLSRRMAFEIDGDPKECFWLLLDNLGFSEFHDKSRYSTSFVDRRVHVVLDRTYDHLGNGGLFPLKYSDHDQRRVEIWYQLCEYLLQEP